MNSTELFYVQNIKGLRMFTPSTYIKMLGSENLS